MWATSMSYCARSVRSGLAVGAQPQMDGREENEARSLGARGVLADLLR